MGWPEHEHVGCQAAGTSPAFLTENATNVLISSIGYIVNVNWFDTHLLLQPFGPSFGGSCLFFYSPLLLLCLFPQCQIKSFYIRTQGKDLTATNKDKTYEQLVVQR